MKRFLSLVIAMLMVMSLLGSFAQAEEVTMAGTPRSETLVVEGLDGVISNASQHNPYMDGTDFSAGLHQLVYSSLWEMDTIQGVQISDLAAELPIPLNDDYTSFKIVLTEGIKWSDGEDFDAEDVVFTFNTLLEHQDTISKGATLATTVKSVEYVDKYELIINTVDSEPRLSDILGSTIWACEFRIIPEHYWKDHDLTTDLWEDPIGTGPYTLSEYDPNGYWFLYKLRDDAEFSDVGVLTGKVPEPKYVLFTAYGTEEKKTMAMLNNEADILCDISPESWDVLQAGNPNIACWLPEYPYGCFEDPCERGMIINCDVAPFDQIDVRWAMALSLDIVQVSMDTFSGQMRVSPLAATPTKFMTESYHDVLRQDLIDYAWEDGYHPFDKDYAIKIGQVLTDDGIYDTSGMTEEELIELFGIGWWKHDPEKAEELLTGAGCERDSEGFWCYNGERISFEIICPSGFETQSERLAYACQSQWYDFGFDVTVQASEASFYNTADDSGNYVVGSYWPGGATTKDLYTRYYLFTSEHYRPNGEMSMNVMRWRSERYDTIMENLSRIPSGDESYELCKEAMMVMMDEVAWLPMFGTTKLVPTNSTYWTNYPDSQNAYNGPWWWWSCFKFIVNEFKKA